MSPRRLGVVTRVDVCCSASSARRSRWATCQYARRAKRAEPATAKTIRRSSARRRESVRPIVSVRLPRSAAADDDRRRKLGEAGVDRELPNRGLLAETVQIGEELLPPNEKGVALRREPDEVVAGRRDSHRLGEREEREQERQDDAAEDEGEAVRAAMGPDGAANPAPWQRRRLDDPSSLRQEG